MLRKIVIGLALVAVVCPIAGSSHAFGKYLKQRERCSEASKAAQKPNQDGELK